MPEISIEISKDVKNQMNKHKEINWNEVIEKTIKDYLKKLETINSVPIQELRKKLEAEDLNLEKLTHEQNIDLYKKMRDAEWNRTYSTRMS
jgi:polyhydroxyalkanoate synthesis regulator phasin